MLSHNVIGRGYESVSGRGLKSGDVIAWLEAGGVTAVLWGVFSFLWGLVTAAG